MEGRLSKVRLVGLRYNGCEIKVGDQKLDFTIPGADGLEIPAHILYILRNGGGKGVFLQSIFQPLDPLCSWKNNENKVAHFFHNSLEKPVQYTFHVVEEWQVSSTKKMMLGISVCPKTSNNHERSFDGGTTIELDYILFSKIYSLSSGFDIFNLPLWDEVEQEALPLSEWKSILSNTLDIYSYSMHKKTDYIQLMEENGIDQHAISIMKSINVSEGSISKYFKDSTDNIGIFHNKIIPTINSRIEEIDPLNSNEVSIITTSFLETLKVAKELPVLLSIIRSIEELNEFTSPLTEMYNEANDLSKAVLHLEQEGQEINFILSKIQSMKLGLKSSTDDQLSSLSKKIEELDWQRENLRYADECKQLETLIMEYKNLSENISILKVHLSNEDYNLSVAHTNVVLKEFHQCFLKVQQIKMSLAILEKECSINELQDQLDKVKEYFTYAWDHIYKNWQQKLTTHYRLRISHNNKFEAYDSFIADEDELNRNIEYSIKRLKEDIDKHKLKQEFIVNEFGEKTRLFPDEVIASYKNNLELKTNTLNNTTKTIDAKFSEIERLNSDLGIAINSIKIHNSKLKTLNEDLKKQTAKESEINHEASILFKENLDELYVRSDYQSLNQRIALFKEKKEHQLKQYNYSLIELEIEMNLIKEGKSDNIYIPNKDLVRLKKILDDNHIQNMYGTQFLKQCTHDERIFNLSRNPALPFSIIVLQENFENVELSFLKDELFNSMVILVDGLKMNKLNKYDTINPSLQKISEINFIPYDQTFVLTTDDYELNTKIVATEKKLDGLIFSVDEKTELISRVNSLQKNLDIMLNGKLSRELEKEIEDTKQLLKGDENQQLNIQSNLTEAHQSISKLKGISKKLESEIVEITNKLERLYQWKQESATFLQNNSDLEDLTKKFNDSKEKLRLLHFQLKSLKEQNVSNERLFDDWMNSVNKDIIHLKTLLEGINLPEPSVDNEFFQDEYLHLASYGNSLESEDYKYLRMYKDLIDKRSSQNSRIGKLQSDLEYQNDKLIELEKNLLELGLHDCTNTEPPMEDLEVLKQIERDLESKVKILKESIINVNAEIDQNNKQHLNLDEKIRDTKHELEERYPNYGAVKLNIDDINQEKEKIKSCRIETIHNRDSLTKTLNDLTKEISDINIIINNLELLHIEGSDKTHILTDDEKINLQENPYDIYDKWFYKLQKAQKELELKSKELSNHTNRIKDFIESTKSLPLNYKNNLLDFLNQIRDMDYTQAIQCIDSYNAWAQHNIQEEHEQTKKADDAVNFWVERASRRVLELCQSIDDLEKKMKIKNWNGILFPLIQMDKLHPFPKKIEDIRYVVKQFCLDMIKEIVEKNPDINNLTSKQLSKFINISNIVLHVIGEYPKLKVYIPSIEGPLLRSEPHNSYYKEWETINHGSSTSSTKSGGQTLMAQFIVMAMIMRQRVDENSWLFLISDNPFGTMSAPELVEAVFSLLELLKIQWLVVAPPITNVHITSKFNTVYQMDVEPVDGEVKLVKKLVKKNRKYLSPISILNKSKYDL